MTLENVKIDHVQITVPPEVEVATSHFYRDILGLTEIAKPAELLKRGGVWFQVGQLQLHVGIEPGDIHSNLASRRHVCFRVPDLALAEARLRLLQVEIIPDMQPSHGWVRFYLLDPGGNRVEVAQVIP